MICRLLQAITNFDGAVKSRFLGYISPPAEFLIAGPPSGYLNEFTFRFNRRFYPFNAFRSLLGMPSLAMSPQGFSVDTSHQRMDSTPFGN